MKGNYFLAEEIKSDDFLMSSPILFELPQAFLCPSLKPVSSGPPTDTQWGKSWVQDLSLY